LKVRSRKLIISAKNRFIMKIGINNMVCPRCIEAVEGIMREMHLPAVSVELGSVELEYVLTDSQQKRTW
jgi:AraC family transcriptional regulator